MLTNLAPPPLALTFREVSAPIEWAQTWFSRAKFGALPKGNKEPIILAPGYMADKWSMRPLKRFLHSLNYQAKDWNLGRNLGQVDEDIVRLGRQTLELAGKTKKPVTLIGWSLGGVICREVARLFPEAVKEVITLGSPVTGGPKYTAVAKRYANRNNVDVDALEKEVLARNAIGFNQPITVIFSKTDGIVGWQAALDVYNAQAKHIEVESTHLGIGVHTDSWLAIAKTLAGRFNEIQYSTLADLIGDDHELHVAPGNRE